MSKKKSQEELSIKITEPGITNLLLNALLNAYSPTGSQSNMELKTTADIIEEMQPIAEIDKYKIQTALENGGFEIKYTDAGYFWTLYKI